MSGASRPVLGVVTIGQTLAMAAHVQGYFSSNLDVTGLAQKYGAVNSHVRIAPRPELLHATRIGAGEADTLIGCDLIVAAGDESMSRLRAGTSRGVVCTDLIPTADFARNPDWQIDAPALVARLQSVLGEQGLLLEGQRLAKALMGDPIAANMFMLGAAWQRGQIPLGLSAIDRAIELNGVAVAMNRQAFLWGRRAAHDLAAVEAISQPTRSASTGSAQVITFEPRKVQTLDELIEHRAAHLVAHTGNELAQRYRALVQRVRDAEASLGTSEALTRAVAHHYHRLLAVKDEWEVARLYSHPDFTAALQREFEEGATLNFHLGAWPFGKADPKTGKPVKAQAGPWVMTAFRWMARFRGLRGSWLDPFRDNAERRLERALLAEYEADLEALLNGLNAAKLPLAARLAAWPEAARGYGHVKAAAAEKARASRQALLDEWNGPLAASPGGGTSRAAA